MSVAALAEAIEAGEAGTDIVAIVTKAGVAAEVKAAAEAGAKAKVAAEVTAPADLKAMTQGGGEYPNQISLRRGPSRENQANPSPRKRSASPSTLPNPKSPSPEEGPTLLSLDLVPHASLLPRDGHAPQDGRVLHSDRVHHGGPCHQNLESLPENAMANVNPDLRPLGIVRVKSQPVTHEVHGPRRTHGPRGAHAPRGGNALHSTHLGTVMTQPGILGIHASHLETLVTHPATLATPHGTDVAGRLATRPGTDGTLRGLVNHPERHGMDETYETYETQGSKRMCPGGIQVQHWRWITKGTPRAERASKTLGEHHMEASEVGKRKRIWT